MSSGGFTRPNKLAKPNETRKQIVRGLRAAVEEGIFRGDQGIFATNVANAIELGWVRGESREEVAFVLLTQFEKLPRDVRTLAMDVHRLVRTGEVVHS